MRVLITGGAGFLGSHLCDRLIESGNEVICMDNFYTGSKKNIEHHLSNPNFELMRHDVVDPFKLEVDQIYNLACPASPIHYQGNPIKTVKTSVMGAINVLGLAKRIGARILQASTSEVYGDPEVHPLKKEDYKGNVNPIGPRACYDEGKRCAETLFFDYYRQNKVDIRVVRIFNTYGPRMMLNDGRVITNFILQALRGENLTVYGHGKQTRSFCYVDDLIDIMIKIMNKNKFHGPLNIGNPSEYTIHDLAYKIIELTDSKSKLVNEPLPQDDPTRRLPDCSKVEKYFENWKASVELDEGLKKDYKFLSGAIKNIVNVLYIIPKNNYYSQFNNVGGHVSHANATIKYLSENWKTYVITGIEKNKTEIPCKPIIYNFNKLNLLTNWAVSKVRDIILKKSIDIIYIRFSLSAILFLYYLSKSNKKIILEINSINNSKIGIFFKKITIKYLSLYSDFK